MEVGVVFAEAVDGVEEVVGADVEGGEVGGGGRMRDGVVVG